MIRGHWSGAAYLSLNVYTRIPVMVAAGVCLSDSRGGWCLPKGTKVLQSWSTGSWGLPLLLAAHMKWPCSCGTKQAEADLLVFFAWTGCPLEGAFQYWGPLSKGRSSGSRCPLWLPAGMSPQWWCPTGRGGPAGFLCQHWLPTGRGTPVAVPSRWRPRLRLMETDSHVYEAESINKGKVMNRLLIKEHSGE